MELSLVVGVTVYMPQGWSKRKIEEENFQLSIHALEGKQLGITSGFSGYIRVFGTTLEGVHDDYYFLIEHGKIVASEKIEIERKIRTIRDDVFEEMNCPYGKCEVHVVKLDGSQLDISKEVNEDCLLEEKIPFKSEIDREALLKQLNTDNIDVERYLAKLKKATL
jgi:hypothetical protein